MTYDLEKNLRSEIFETIGPLRYYVYEWILEDTTKYVGRGTGERYKMFYLSKKYGNSDRHKFVLENKNRLKCRFSIFNVSLDCAKEAESLLIEHWGLIKNGGTLFNEVATTRPIIKEFGENRKSFALFNLEAAVPPLSECLSLAGFYDIWYSEKQEWSDDAVVSYTGNPSCWRPKHHGKPVKGWTLDKDVLKKCLPATVSEIIEFAKSVENLNITERQIRAKHGHLSWGVDKGYLIIK